MRIQPVEFHVLPGSCEPILAGKKAEQLDILIFQGIKQERISEVYSMISTEIDTEEGENFYEDIQNIVSPYAHCYVGIGCLRDHLVKFYIDDTIKPVEVLFKPTT